MTDYIIKTFIGLACAGIFGFCVEYIKRSIIKQKAIEVEIKALAHDALFRFCRYLMPLEEITEAQHENLEYLMRGYRKLKMNGTAEKMYNQIMAKPIKTEETKYE